MESTENNMFNSGLESQETKQERKRNNIEWVGDNIVVTTRSGKKYVMSERSEDVMKKCREASAIKKVVRNQETEDINEDVFFSKLIVASCDEPKLTDLEFQFGKLPASEAIALRKAVLELYDIDSFL